MVSTLPLVQKALTPTPHLSSWFVAFSCKFLTLFSLLQFFTVMCLATIGMLRIAVPMAAYRQEVLRLLIWIQLNVYARNVSLYCQCYAIYSVYSFPVFPPQLISAVRQQFGTKEVFNKDVENALDSMQAHVNKTSIHPFILS